jgi:hypothetical protein
MSPRRNWDSPTPSLACECAPPPGTSGAGTLAGRLGGVPIPTTGEKLSTLPTLCPIHRTVFFTNTIDFELEKAVSEYRTYDMTY